MRADRISYQKLFPLGMYINEKIGVECIVNEGENPATILQEAKLMVEKFHKDSNPGLYIEVNYEALSVNNPDYSPPTNEQRKEEATNGMIAAINSCTELKVLETFKLLVKNNTVFQEAYFKKEQELKT
jgi:Na+-transporting NADH:ubiquinone oxidoreductase subunit NqrF